MPSDPAPAPAAGDPADRRADDALAVVRHDLKTPLTTISGQMQLARRRARRMEGPDRDYLLERLAAVEAALLVLGERIERLGREALPRRAGDPPTDDAPP